MKTEPIENYASHRIGFYSSILMAVLTLITFGFAITAVPKSGVFCMDNCMEYPFLDSLNHYPKDYIWMYLAALLIITYMIYSVSIHSIAALHHKIFSRIGLAFALLSSVTLIICYFIQFSVIPVSLMNKETEGIALFTQYNPHGIFIALEELGYFLMSLSFLFIAPVFLNESIIQKCIAWIFIAAFIFTILSFVYVVVKYGVKRDYRFEIIAISINWLVLITNGILCGIVFKRAMKV